MPEKDSILREQYYIISNLWKSAINIRKIHDKVNLKDWAYQYSVNVCYKGLITDLVGLCFLLVLLLGLVLLYFVTWNSEFVMRCVIFEEQSDIVIDSYRYDTQ